MRKRPAEVAQVDEHLRPHPSRSVGGVRDEDGERPPRLLEEAPRRYAANGEVRLEVDQLAGVPQRDLACCELVDYSVYFVPGAKHVPSREPWSGKVRLQT